MSDPATVAPPGTPLTAAEERALRLMAVVASEAEAARDLGVSRHTVHAHLRNARSRLGVRTTRQAVGLVARNHAMAPRVVTPHLKA